MKQQIENIIKKNLPREKGLQNGIDFINYELDKKEQGFNDCLSQIDTPLIADEVLKVVESATRFYALSPQWIEDGPAWLCILTKGNEVLIEKVLTQKELSSAYYRKTNNYASPVITVDQVEIGGRYILEQLLSTLSPNKENEK